MDLGVEKVELEELFKRADFITLHTPLTEKTKNIIDAAALKRMKKGVRIINCARGGLVDEAALYDALKSGHVAGAAFDVFVEEPATSNPLFTLPNVVCTPHLGAATTRGAGERRAADRRADVGLSAARRDLQRRQLPLDHRRGGAAAQAVHRARREARLVRRPAHRGRHHQDPDQLRGRGGADEDQGADLGGDGRLPAADAAGRQRGVGAGRRQGARHRGRGDDARGRGRLREPDHRHGDDAAADALGVRHGVSPTAGRASSTSRASGWTPSSAPP